MEQPERIIHQIYEAARNPEYWSVVCDDLSEMVSGGSVHLLLASTETGHEYVNLFAKGDPAFASEYLRDYAAIDFRVPRVMARELGALADEREYVASLDVRKSPIYQELLPRYDVHNISGANLSLDGCIGWFGISTARSSSEFDTRQIGMLGQVSRHLLNALKIEKSQQDLRLSRDAAFAGLDLPNVALLLFDLGTLEYVNAAARRLIENGFFFLRQDTLSCTLPAENRQLVQFLERAAAGQDDGSILLRNPDDAACYVVRSHGVGSTYAGAGTLMSRRRVVSIVDLNTPSDCGADEVAEFCVGYGVSRSETKVVHAVLTSTSLAELAEDRGISLGTIQQQLKSAMLKMELNSQKKIFQAFERFRFVGKNER